MARVIVRGGMPGKIRVELEGDETSGVELDGGMTAYQFAHELAPWMQAQIDAALVQSAPAPARTSKRPPAGDA